MSARRLQHWAVEYYAAPEARACIVLEGRERQGFLSRRCIPVAERISLPVNRVVPSSYQANQALVRRAMHQSNHRWRGAVP